jgi:hypothetical protein
MYVCTRERSNEDYELVSFVCTCEWNQYMKHLKVDFKQFICFAFVQNNKSTLKNYRQFFTIFTLFLLYSLTYVGNYV